MTALATWKGWMLQHPLYRQMKDSGVVKNLRKKHRDSYLSGKTSENADRSKLPINKPADYKMLRGFYREMLEMMDCVHFNSNVTHRVYEDYLGRFPSQTISITHLDIKDNRRKKSFTGQLRLTYLGPRGEAKGFFCSRRHSTNCGTNGQILS
jgi:hypothetical protein